MIFSRRQTQGFSIVELLVVIVVIAILAAIVIVAYNGIQNRAKDALVQSDASQAGRKVITSRIESSTDTYPSSLAAAGLNSNSGAIYQYTYTASDNSFCLTASRDTTSYWVSSSSTSPSAGACPGHSVSGGASVPSGYESAPLAGGARTDFNGYSPIQPLNCPTSGGSWIKVPGNSVYGQTNGFCVQQYPARNVNGVATSAATGARWTAVTQPAAKTAAEGVTSGSHLLSESEWMTIATNAAAQPQNWSGGAVGAGSLPTGSSTSAYGGVAVVLSNGQTIYFDTGLGSGYASNEWTCYTGSQANSCGLAAQSQPIPANAYYTDQFGTFTSYGALQTSGSYYYGDPRYANPNLAPYVTSARNAGLGYLRSSYAAGSSTIYNFNRGAWTGTTASGLFTMYMFTVTSYAHATYGFRAAF